MIGKDHIRRLQALHIDLFDFIFFADEHDFGKHPDEPSQIDRLTDGIFCGLIAFFVFIVDVNIHKSFLQNNIFLLYQMYTKNAI